MNEIFLVVWLVLCPHNSLCFANQRAESNLDSERKAQITTGGERMIYFLLYGNIICGIYSVYSHNYPVAFLNLCGFIVCTARYIIEKIRYTQEEK